MDEIKGKIFDLIRRLCWSDYDPNEDFNCMFCGKPVFRRFLFCSVGCTTKFNKKYNE